MNVVSRIGWVVVALVLQHATGRRIIEGDDALKHAFPYQVSLQWNFNNGSKSMHFCSGSILNARWILTAAHCDDRFSKDGWIEVVAAEHNVCKEEDGEQRRNVSQFIQHEKFDLMSIVNDIGVIKLSEKLQLNKHVQTINLSKKAFNGTSATVAGWGSISKNLTDIFPDELKKVNLTIVEEKNCTKYHRVDKTQICAGGFGKGICSADSGGPLTFVENGKVMQIGIVSYGEKPCSARYPGVFVNTVHYYDWIQSKIKPTSS